MIDPQVISALLVKMFGIAVILAVVSVAFAQSAVRTQRFLTSNSLILTFSLGMGTVWGYRMECASFVTS